MTCDISLNQVIVIHHDNEMTVRQATFVDDIRVGGRCSLAREGCRKLKGSMNSVGNQADDQIYWQPSPAAGAWKGSIIPSNTPFSHKSTTGKKWVKLKLGLDWVLEHKTASGFAVTLEL